VWEIQHWCRDAVRAALDAAQRQNAALRRRAADAEVAAARAEESALMRQCTVNFSDQINDLQNEVNRAREQRDKDLDTIRKQDIELNILRGTVRTLRERDDKMAVQVRDAGWKVDHLRTETEAGTGAQSESRGGGESWELDFVASGLEILPLWGVGVFGFRASRISSWGIKNSRAKNQPT
jgi:hypothetical protein